MNFLTKNLVRNISNSSGHSANNMKRFYKQSTFKINQQPPHPLHKYLIQLDGKSMKTPYRNTLAVPSKALALMVSNEFNRQGKLLKTIEMPILSMSRTAVDADIEGHLAEHLKSTIFEYLKTDTILFHEDKFDERYQRLVHPLIDAFNKRFNMSITPSTTLQPPTVEFSQQFVKYIHSLNNWQLIGLETMIVWMKSTICAFSVANTDFDPSQIQKASYLEQTIQMECFGQVEQRIMDINQIRMMVACGEMFYKLSHE